MPRFGDTQGHRYLSLGDHSPNRRTHRRYPAGQLAHAMWAYCIWYKLLRLAEPDLALILLEPIPDLLSPPSRSLLKKPFSTRRAGDNRPRKIAIGGRRPPSSSKQERAASGSWFTFTMHMFLAAFPGSALIVLGASRDQRLLLLISPKVSRPKPSTQRHRHHVREGRISCFECRRDARCCEVQAATSSAASSGGSEPSASASRSLATGARGLIAARVAYLGRPVRSKPRVLGGGLRRNFPQPVDRKVSVGRMA